MNTCCVVIGGYVNGYSIIQELDANKVSEIILVDFEKSISYYSNKITDKYIIEKSSNALLDFLFKLKERYDLLVLYPTQDVHLNYLHDIYNEVETFTFIAFNPESVIHFQEKIEQYKVCEKLNIPYPKTQTWISEDDIEEKSNYQFPIIVKPNTRDNLSTDIFRNLIINDKNEFVKYKNKLIELIKKGNSFLVSEIIPGAGDKIFAHVLYTDKNDKILGEWTGKKLSQFPNDFGVFASAISVGNEIVAEYSRKLIKEMKLWGINEPEFKYDVRDKQYKLMEINLRPMMWHRVGAINGVNLNYIQYLNAKGVEINNISIVETYKTTHHVNLFYEIINLLTRKKYWKVFKKNIFHKPIDVAGFDKKDIKPFLYMFVVIIRKYIHKSKRDSI